MYKLVLTSFFITCHCLLICQDSLTYKQCLDSALAYNLRLNEQKINEKSYHLNIKSARNARLPIVSNNISTNLSWGRGIDPFTNTYVNQQFNTYNGSLNASLTLFNGFYHLNNIKFQLYDIEKNKSEIQKIKNDLAIDIAMRYTNILYLKESIQYIRNQVAQSQINLEITQKKIDAGTLAKRELYKAMAQKESEELNLIQMENQLETNLLELKQLMGKNLNAPIQIKSMEYLADPQFTKSEFIQKSILQSPSLSLQKINIQKSKLSIAMAKSGFYPTISLNGQLGSTYSTNNRQFSLSQQLDNNFSYGFNLNAQIPIFNQFSTRNKVKEAQYNMERAQIQLEIENQSLMKTLTKTYLDLTMSKKKSEVSKSTMTSNQINYETEKIKYDAGRISLQDLNISKSNLFNSISTYTRDKYEYLFNILVTKIYKGELR